MRRNEEEEGGGREGRWRGGREGRWRGKRILLFTFLK